MATTIEVIIAPDGQVSIEGLGFKGADCEKATRYIEAALGMVTHKKRKTEYYSSTTTTKQRARV